MVSLRNISFFLVATVVLMGAGGYVHLAKSSGKSEQQTNTYKTVEESDVYVRFVMEAYDLIQKEYWQKASDADLSQHFELSIQKAAATTTSRNTQDRAGVANLVSRVMRGATDTRKKELSVQTVQIALFNLQPVARAQLLSQQARTELTNTVTNVNPDKDLYKSLDLPKGAPTSSVEAAFQKKVGELAATTSPEKEKAIAEAKYAKEVLANSDKKALYDEAKIEPTVFSRIIGARTLYVYIQKMSPTTQSEFEKALKAEESNEAVTNFILDLRGNIGGDLTFAQTFLGLFLGPNQYAYDIFHAGAYEAQRTIAMQKLPAITRFREIAVLTDNMTQSTAEIITAALKRDHRAVAVGDTTRGWGSIEQIIPMQTHLGDESYSVLLVIGLTVADDAQQIEGRGVAPHVSIKEDGWQNKLAQRFFSADLVSAVKKTVTASPLK